MRSSKERAKAGDQKIAESDAARLQHGELSAELRTYDGQPPPVTEGAHRRKEVKWKIPPGEATELRSGQLSAEPFGYDGKPAR